MRTGKIIWTVRKFYFDKIHFMSENAQECHDWCKKHNNGEKVYEKQEYHVLSAIKWNDGNITY